VLFVVRHGQTAANAQGLLLGRADPPLTELGRKQAAAIAEALPPPSLVVSSPLVRARETAGAFGAPVVVDERWIEMDYGTLDCAPIASVPGEVWERWRSDVTFVPAGGESLVDVGARVRAACDEVWERAVREDVVVVTHVSPIKAAVTWALGVDDEVVWRLFVAEAAVCRIGLGVSGPVVRAFNETHPPRPAG
jgi:broad specificity phosphatase PhoE